MKSANRWLFFVLGLVVLVVFGYGGYQMGRYFLREPISNNLANNSAENSNRVKMSLGNFQELEGTPYLMAPVNSQKNYRQNYYDKKSFSIRNYLFVNGDDKSARRLVPNNDFLFLNAQEVVLQRREDKIVRGMWYEVVKVDTNNDERLTDEDKRTVAVSDVSGSDYTEVIDEIDRVLGWHQKSSTTLLIFYEFERREYIAEINIPRRILIEKQVLPSIQ